MHLWLYSFICQFVRLLVAFWSAVLLFELKIFYFNNKTKRLVCLELCSHTISKYTQFIVKTLFLRNLKTGRAVPPFGALQLLYRWKVGHARYGGTRYVLPVENAWQRHCTSMEVCGNDFPDLHLSCFRPFFPIVIASILQINYWIIISITSSFFTIEFFTHNSSFPAGT